MLISDRDYELTFADFAGLSKGCKYILLFAAIRHLHHLQNLYHLCLRHLPVRRLGMIVYTTIVTIVSFVIILTITTANSTAAFN
jgi:hypothetical protein